MSTLAQNLNVLVTANAKQFQAVMAGVNTTTAATDSAWKRLAYTGKAVGAGIAIAFAGGAIAAVAFGKAVRGMSDQLMKISASNGLRAGFLEMANTMDEIGDAITINIAKAMQAAMPGFTALLGAIRDITADTAFMTSLFAGLNAVFLALSWLVEKAAAGISVLVSAFKLMQTLTKAWVIELGVLAGLLDEDLGADEIAGLNIELGKILNGGTDASNALFGFVDSQKQVTAAVALTNEQLMRQAAIERQLVLDQLRAKALRETNADTLETQTHAEIALNDARAKSYHDTMLSIQADGYMQTQMQAYVSKYNADLAKADMDSRAQQAAFYEMTWQDQYAMTRGILTDLSTLMESENRKMFEIGKAAAIGQAIIDTISSAQKAFNSLAGIPYIGPALGAAAAGAALAAGYMRVNQIRSTQFGGSGGGGGGAGGGASTPSAPAASAGGGQSTNVNVTLMGDTQSSGSVRALIEKINGATDDNTVLRVNGGR